MKKSIYSDESWFPQSSLQSVCLLVGSPEACAQVRSAFQELLAQAQIKELKRSKIRAKKKLFAAAQAVFSLVESMRAAGPIELFSGVGEHAKEVYRQLMQELHTAYPDQKFDFFPDKNLTLQRHRKHHLLSECEFVAQVQPVVAADEPLIMICDLYAGMLRDQATRPELFTSPFEKILYTPDKYKRALYEGWKNGFWPIVIDVKYTKSF